MVGKPGHGRMGTRTQFSAPAFPCLRDAGSRPGRRGASVLGPVPRARACHARAEPAVFSAVRTALGCRRSRRAARARLQTGCCCSPAACRDWPVAALKPTTETAAEQMLAGWVTRSRPRPSRQPGASGLRVGHATPIARRCRLSPGARTGRAAISPHGSGRTRPTTAGAGRRSRSSAQVGRGAIVDAHVAAVRAELRLPLRFRFIEQFKHRTPCLWPGAEGA